MLLIVVVLVSLYLFVSVVSAVVSAFSEQEEA